METIELNKSDTSNLKSKSADFEANNKVSKSKRLGDKTEIKSPERDSAEDKQKLGEVKDEELYVNVSSSSKKSNEPTLLTVEEDDDDLDYDITLTSSNVAGGADEDVSFVSVVEPSPMGLCTLFEVGSRFCKISLATIQFGCQ